MSALCFGGREIGEPADVRALPSNFGEWWIQLPTKAGCLGELACVCLNLACELLNWVDSLSTECSQRNVQTVRYGTFKLLVPGLAQREVGGVSKQMQFRFHLQISMEGAPHWAKLQTGGSSQSFERMLHFLVHALRIFSHAAGKTDLAPSLYTAISPSVPASCFSFPHPRGPHSYLFLTSLSPYNLSFCCC